jgi:hypothetical protein
MKLLLESWRQYLTESHEGCPEKHPRGDYKVYYDIDRNDPPSIKNILDCWVENYGAANVNSRKPAFYNTEDLTPYREYAGDKLRNPPGTKRYKDLKDEIIAENGIKDPLIIFFGQNGVVKIGEGNHRHEIALELGMPKVPVRFIFWENVFLKGANVK